MTNKDYLHYLERGKQTPELYQSTPKFAKTKLLIIPILLISTFIFVKSNIHEQREDVVISNGGILEIYAPTYGQAHHLQIVKDTWQDYLNNKPVNDDVKQWVTRIVLCESMGNPYAVNQQEIIINGVSYGHATGLGQFLYSTWRTGEQRYLGRSADIYNYKDQIDMLIAFYQDGQAYQWSCN